jgi:hypothetical protein
MSGPPWHTNGASEGPDTGVIAAETRQHPVPKEDKTTEVENEVGPQDTSSEVVWRASGGRGEDN